MAARRLDVRYSPELAEDICEKLASGKTLRQVCREPGMPDEAAVRLWAREDRDGFAPQYARARELGYACMADETIEIADDGSNDTYKKDGVELTNHDVIARSRLRVEQRRWMLSKMLPKIYGDKLDVNHSGELAVKGLELEQLESRIADLIGKAGTVGAPGGAGETSAKG